MMAMNLISEKADGAAVGHVPGQRPVAHESEQSKGCRHRSANPDHGQRTAAPSGAYLIGCYGSGMVLPARKSAIDTVHTAPNGLNRQGCGLFAPTDPYWPLQSDPDFDEAFENR